MKKASDVFKAIRFAKSEPRGKAHKSTDDEGHYTVGEKEFNQQLQHVKKRAMMEAVKDKFDIGEYDQEGDMAKSDLRSILANAKRVHDMLEDSDNLPEWVQSKITKAEDYMSTVANYMEAEMNEETEIQESGGPVVYKKGDDHIEKYGEDSFALYKNGKKAKYYTSLEAAKEAMNEEVKAVTVKHKTSGKELVVTPEKAKQLKPQGYHPVKEDVEQIDEKNVPTSPEKWSQAKSQAKAKFDVYPSAYANGWAAKKYKEMGGSWKSVSEESEQLEESLAKAEKYKSDGDMLNYHKHMEKHHGSLAAKEFIKNKFKENDVFRKHNNTAMKHYDSYLNLKKEEVEQVKETKEMGGGWKSVSEETKPPFEGPYTKVTGTVTDKSGAKHTPMSRVRDIARMAMKKQVEKMKKPVKEEASMKAKIVKDVMKKKKEKVTDDSFQKDPIISKSEVKM
jgi:hypothetical protein